MVAKAGRPEEIPDSAQMHEVARLFYQEDATRQQISQRLHIDPRKVTWLLEQARALGVVRIDIRDSLEGEIAARLQRKFPKLERVLIVSGPRVETSEQCDDFMRRSGVLAADYFEELLQHHSRRKPFHLGVSGDPRLLEFAKAVRPSIRDNVYVHATALMGRTHSREDFKFVEPGAVATTIWIQCGAQDGRCLYVTVEPFWPEKMQKTTTEAYIRGERRRLEKFADVRSAILGMNELDAVFGAFTFVGFGSKAQVGERQFSMDSYYWLSGDLEIQFANQGMIGEFCNCPFDAEGNSQEDWRFFLTAGHYSEHKGIDFYKHMVDIGKRVVGIAGGPALAPVVTTALKAGIVNVLIVDEYTARQLTGMN